MVWEAEEDMCEFEVNDKELDELIRKLKELKLSHKHFHISLKNNKNLLIHHEKDQLK